VVSQEISATAPINVDPNEDDRRPACEHEIVRLSLDNLMSFRWVRESVEAGRLSLHGFYFGDRANRPSDPSIISVPVAMPASELSIRR
jgi:carbonic anhydrase